MHNNPFRDDPFQDDGHLLAPGHPFRKLSGLSLRTVRLFLYRAPEPRPIDCFHPCKHHHRFTPSPYRSVTIPGDTTMEFYTDTRIPPHPCPLLAFADAEGRDFSTFQPIHYLWYVGTQPLPGQAPAGGAPTDSAPTDSQEIAFLLHAFFKALRQFPADWTSCPPWNHLHIFTNEEMEQI